MSDTGAETGGPRCRHGLVSGCAVCRCYELETALKAAERRERQWRNNHDGQVATKRRLSKLYGELLAGKREVEARLTEAETALGRIRYLANVNFSDAGEMSVAVDRIAEIVDGVVSPGGFFPGRPR